MMAGYQATPFGRHRVVSGAGVRKLLSFHAVHVCVCVCTTMSVDDDQ